MPNINEYTGEVLDIFKPLKEEMTTVNVDVPNTFTEADAAKLEGITDPNLRLQAVQALGDNPSQNAAKVATKFGEDFMAKQEITDPGVAVEYARYLNDYKGPQASIDFMTQFQKANPQLNTEAPQPGSVMTDQQLYQQRLNYLDRQSQQPEKITFGGFAEEKLPPRATTPIQEGLNSARKVTETVFPSLNDNVYENRAALRDAVNRSNLNMQDAYRKGDMELVQSMKGFIDAATNALNAISYGANNSKVYGNELGINTPRRGAMEPVRPGDSQVRDLSRVEQNIIAANPSKANYLSNFQIFRKLLENDNRYNLSKPQLAYLLATVDYQTRGTFSANSEEQLPLGIDHPEDILAQNLRASGFHGRGYSGLRGKDLYIGMSQIVGQDLVNNPAKLSDPQVSYNVFIEGVMNGLFTGKRLTDYINAQQSDFYNARNTMTVDHNGAKDIMVMANRYLEEL